jgi:hypothetical protein
MPSARPRGLDGRCQRHRPGAGGDDLHAANDVHTSIEMVSPEALRRLLARGVALEAWLMYLAPTGLAAAWKASSSCDAAATVRLP